ncbi:MAG: DUF2922 domain-containing protein [Anaerococcus sp.]
MNSEKIKLSFADSQSKSRMLTVDYPKEEITGTQVQQAMDNIISSQVLLGKESTLDTKVKAYREILERNEYNIE